MDEIETTETSEPTEKSFSEELRDQVIFSAAATAATLVTIVVIPPVINGVSAGAKKAIEAAGGSVTEQRIEAEAKAAARVEKRNAAKGKAPAPKAPLGDANKISARAKRAAAKA